MSISKSSVGFVVVLVVVVTCVKQSQTLGLGLSLEFDKIRCKRFFSILDFCLINDLANIRFNCKEQAVQCTKTKREQFAGSPPQAPRQAPGPTTPGYGPPPPSWPSSTARSGPQSSLAAAEQRHYLKLKN